MSNFDQRSPVSTANSRVAEAVMKRRDELIGLTKRFVAFPTTNPPGTDLVECQQWICDRLESYEIPLEVIESSTTGGDHKIIVGTVGSSGPVMYFHGHYDVVPEFSASQFAAVERNGSLIGRGTCDMKGGLVALLIAAVIHRELGGGGQVKLVFVPDEETGGVNGSERLEELGVITSAPTVGAVIAEPSYPDIWYAARGAFTVEVTITGRPAHVGLHYTGVNALTIGHAVLGQLMSFGESVAMHKTSLRIEPEAARSSIVLIGGTSGGGTNFNIVPDQFRFTIDRRPNPDEDYAGAKAALLDQLDELARHHPLSYEVLQDVDPALTAPDAELIRSTRCTLLTSMSPSQICSSPAMCTPRYYNARCRRPRESSIPLGRRLCPRNAAVPRGTVGHLSDERSIEVHDPQICSSVRSALNEKMVTVGRPIRKPDSLGRRCQVLRQITVGADEMKRKSAAVVDAICDPLPGWRPTN